MKMSYRRAWLLLKALNGMFGKPLAVTATGGKKGGGARLTPLGRAVVTRYRGIERKAGKVAAPDVKFLVSTLSSSEKHRRPATTRSQNRRKKPA